MHIATVQSQNVTQVQEQRETIKIIKLTHIYIYYTSPDLRQSHIGNDVFLVFKGFFRLPIQVNGPVSEDPQVAYPPNPEKDCPYPRNRILLTPSAFGVRSVPHPQVLECNKVQRLLSHWTRFFCLSATLLVGRNLQSGGPWLKQGATG